MPSVKEIYHKIDDVRIEADSINLNVDGLEALASTQQADVAAIKTDIANGVTINQPVAVTDNNGSLTVDGTVGISGTVPVSGTFWQSVQPIEVRVGGSAAATNNPLGVVLGLGGSAVADNNRLPVTAAQTTAANLNATVVGSGSFTAAQATAANLNATVVQGTATNLKTQAENYQGGSAVGSGNPLQVTLANTGANATAVKVDGSAVTQPVTNRGATGEATVSNFTSTTSATLKSSNSNRKVLTIYNEGAGNLHVLYGSGTASATNYSVKLFSGDYLEIDKYTGQVNAIFATAGTARVTEIT